MDSFQKFRHEIGEKNQVTEHSGTSSVAEIIWVSLVGRRSNRHTRIDGIIDTCKSTRGIDGQTRNRIISVDGVETIAFMRVPLTHIPTRCAKDVTTPERTRESDRVVSFDLRRPRQIFLDVVSSSSRSRSHLSSSSSSSSTLGNSIVPTNPVQVTIFHNLRFVSLGSKRDTKLKYANENRKQLIQK